MPRKIILNEMKTVRHVFATIVPAICALFLTVPWLSSQSASKENAQPSTSNEFQQFEKDIETIRAELKIPGMAAAVVRDGKMVWRRNFGETDAESHAPVTDQTLFPIASISKTMAAVVIMQLVNEGKLKLSDPITKYRPELPFPPTITIERIMSHTAEGIPGEEFLYSGALYGLLTGVIERVEHKPYAQVLNERIFHPLQMNDTLAGLPADKSATNTKSVATRIATGYQLDPQTHEAAPLSIDLSRISTATGVISDIGDLAKYATALDTDKLVPRATMELISTPQRSTRGGTLPYGLGWFAEEYLGEQIVWHYGQERNYSSLFVRVPSRHLTFIMLANSVALSDAPRLSDGELARSPAALAFLADVVAAVNPRVCNHPHRSNRIIARRNFAQRAGEHSAESKCAAARARCARGAIAHRVVFGPRRQIRRADDALHRSISWTRLAARNRNAFLFGATSLLRIARCDDRSRACACGSTSNARSSVVLCRSG